MARTPKPLLAQLMTTMEVLADKGRGADVHAAAALDLLLDANELAALRWVGSRGAVTMRSLADHLGIVASSATSLVDRLVAKELVERVRDEVDRRIVLVSLAPMGREIWQRTVDERARLCREMLASFGPTEQVALTDLLGRMLVPESASSVHAATPATPATPATAPAPAATRPARNRRAKVRR